MAALASTFHPGRGAARTSSTPQLLRRSCRTTPVWSGADRPARARCLQKGRRRPVEACWDRRAVLFADLQGELLSDRRRHFVFGQQGRHRRVDATIRRDAFHARDSPVSSDFSQQRLGQQRLGQQTFGATSVSRTQSAELSQQNPSQQNSASTHAIHISFYIRRNGTPRPPASPTHTLPKAGTCVCEGEIARASFPSLSLLLRPCGVRARA